MTQQQIQYMKVFWDSTFDRRLPELPLPPTEDEVRLAISANNQRCPLNKIIYGPENDGNMRTLRRLAFTALKRHHHSCRGCNFGIYAQSGQGKTFVVKQFAETVEIPLVFVQSASLSDTAMLFDMICAECEKNGTPIVPYKPTPDTKADFTLPPVIVFFDEAHTLSTKMMTGGLLNAMEPDDGLMVVKRGRTGSMLVDCKDVCWIGATTEKGKLFDAFANRLGTDIEWRSAAATEVAQIVKQKLDRKAESGEIAFSMPLEACEIVARYRRVPREAINFGLKVIQQRDMLPSDTWDEAAAQVARDIGLDEWGFTRKQVAILAAMGQRPIAEKRLAAVAKCRMEQVERYELPMLIDYSNGGPLVVSVTGRGMCITEAGLRELDKRGISHKGRKITAEHFEERR